MHKKRTEILFQRPVKVVQVFRQQYRYGKDQKSFEDRKEEMTWRPMPSQNGHVAEGVLYLPERMLQNGALPRCDLITIEDDNGSQGPLTSFVGETTRDNLIGAPDYNHCFSLHHPNKLDIFELRQGEELELHLDWGYFKVGIPERENFKIGVLRKGNPLEVKINGKTDASLSARRARTFLEQHYVLELLGEFGGCTLLQEPFSPVVKEVPAERKVVDLVKPLW